VIACLACEEYDPSLLRYSDASSEVVDATADLPAEASQKDAAPETGAEGGGDAAKDAGDAGTPPCSNTQQDCDGDPDNGCETDLTSDPDHCGACGHDCLEGACENQRCQPFEMAAGQGAPTMIATDATHVYWTDQQGHGAMMRAEKHAGSVEQVAVTDHAPGGIAVDAQSVFWSEFGEFGTIWRLDKEDIGEGVPPTALVGDQATSANMAEDGVAVFWTTPGTIKMIDKSGGERVLLADGQGTPFGLVAELGEVYWANSSTGEIMGYDLKDPDSGARQLASGSIQPLGLAADYANLYWADYQGSPDGGTPSVMKIAKVNMTEPVVLADDQLGPAGVAVSGNDLFWTNNVGGTVMRMPKLGGTPVEIAGDQSAPSGIATDADAVYWVNRDDGRVMALAR